MLAVVALFFLAALALSEWKVRDRISSWVARLYLGWWALCLGASTFDPMGIFPVSGYAYFVLLLSVGLFLAGFIAVSPGTDESPDPRARERLSASFREVVEENRVVLYTLVALFPILLRYYLRYLSVLGEVGPGEARNLRFYVGPVFGSTIEVLAFNYLAEPLAIALIAVIAYELVLGTPRQWIFLWVVADAYLLAGIGGGRTLIVQGVIFLVLLLVLRGSLGRPAPGADGEGASDGGAPGRRRIQAVVTVAVALLVLALFMVYQTFSRMVSMDLVVDASQRVELLELAVHALLDQVWSYSLGPFRALDHALHNPTVFGYHFGTLTFGAIDEMIGYPLRLLGFDYTITNHEIGAITQEGIYIGSDDFNALYTGAFRFYYDFGIAGVVLLSFLFGAVVRGVVLWFSGSPSVATLLAMLFLVSAAILSTQTWHLASPAAVVFLGGCALLHRATGEQATT